MTTALSRRALVSGLVLAPAAMAHARARPFAWPGGKRAAVSLTYDDGLNSQLEYAIPALQARGLRGTFFLVQENMDARLADWVSAAAQGHEIGDHTYTHPCQMQDFSPASFADQQIAPMESYLDQHFGAAGPRSFAYPCGFLGLGRGAMNRRLVRYRLALEHTFTCARTVAGGPNDPAQVMRDRFDLKAFEPTYDADVIGPAVRYLRETLAMGGWAILVFHDVAPQRIGEGSTTVARHAQILDLIQAQSFWCAPMGEVFRQVASTQRI